MTQAEFLNQLKKSLEARHIKNVDEIISDYKEHFEHALAEKKTENEICEKLGSAEVIAQAYETESMVSRVKDTNEPFKLKFALNVLLRLIVIAPFNFLVIFVPGAVLFAFLVAGWALVLAFASVGPALFTAAVQAHLMALSFWVAASVVSLSLLSVCMTIIFVMIMGFMTKHLVLFIINYLQWNLKFILQK
jgi:uncharacterized membrane protein